MEIKVFDKDSLWFRVISVEELTEYTKKTNCVVRVMTFWQSPYPDDIPSALYVAIDETKN